MTISDQEIQVIFGVMRNSVCRPSKTALQFNHSAHQTEPKGTGVNRRMLRAKRFGGFKGAKVADIPVERRSLALSIALPLIFLCVIFSGAASHAQDLQAAYQQAASTSPLIAQARAQLDADSASKPLARAALLPHVNGEASGGMNTAHVTGFGPQPISTGYHSDIFSVSLTETIFNGQAFTALKQSNSRIQASEAALAYAQQVIALEVTQAYFGVLEAEANQRVAQQQRDLLQSIDEQAETSLRVGTGDIISVQEVQAQLDAAKADLISATNAVAVAKNQLETPPIYSEALKTENVLKEFGTRKSLVPVRFFLS
jgi:hypothetical protein